MKYKVFFNIKAKKELDKLSLPDQKKLTKVVNSLENNPTPSIKNFRPLTGYDNLYRLRVGDLRIIYSITEQRKEVIIEKVGKRNEKLYKLLSKR